jgi:hypothetical protein
MFRNSAKCFEALRRPYAAMMWALARDSKAASESADNSVREFIVSEGRYPSDQSGQLAFPLLVEGANEGGEKGDDNVQARRDRFRRVVSEVTAFSTAPLGIMGLPTESYLSLAASMERDADPHEIEYQLLPFLSAYDVAIMTARSKAYHWKKLLMPFHPIEPDILSVFSVANAWFKLRDITLTDFVRERTDSRFASKLLSAALEQMEG